MSKISVVIPTYNRALLVGDAIESALNQQYRDIEILVVDDGSADQTRDVVAPYLSGGVVRYLWQENRGVSAARNKGIREAQGEFIAFLDSDDVWVPGHLTQLHNALSAHQEARLAFSNFVFGGYGADAEAFNQSFTTSVQKLLSRSFSKREDGVWVSTGQLLKGLFEVGFPFRIQGSMAHTALLRDHGLQFDEAMSFTEEAQFVVEAACHTRVLFVEDVGVTVRRHEENGDQCYGDKITSSYERRMRRLKELFAGKLVGDERRALKHVLWKMQSHIMNERTRDRHVPAMIIEGTRLLIEVPSYASLKSVTKMIVRRRQSR